MILCALPPPVALVFGYAYLPDNYLEIFSFSTWTPGPWPGMTSC
jgi:hypothetical protein